MLNRLTPRVTVARVWGDGVGYLTQLVPDKLGQDGG